MRTQGATGPIPPHLKELLDAAFARFEAEVDGRGVLETILAEDFAGVYRGEGQNDDPAPLATIFPRASMLALFVVTVGERLGAAASELMAARDFAAAALLDAVASQAADRAVDLAGQALTDSAKLDPDLAVLPYSPGYCGWHLTGQRLLFERLQPEEIGITLQPSCFMQPSKSVSGVLVAGPPQIHDFDNDYVFCRRCIGLTCRDRIASPADRESEAP
jgi:hypothetical protein